MATHAAFMPGVKAQSRAWAWLTTVDHKRIGILYGATAFAFFLLAGLESLLMRAQLARPDNTLMGPQTYSELFTMHGTTMIFLAVMPLSTAFINFAVPLLIGARDVAFPRLNALSYWLFLAGGLLLNAGWLFDAVPDAGWFGYANLTSRQFSPGANLDVWILALLILGISSILGALNFVVTILNMRAPSMKLLWMPLFVWMVLVTQFLVLLAFPPLTVGMLLLMFDRFFGTVFFSPAAGGEPLLWQHLFWMFGHPEVYILILPPMGIISEVIPTFAAKPLFGAPMMIYAGIAIGFLSFGVWSHHMFAAGLGPAADSAFSVITLLIAVPTGVKILNWIMTLWGGRIRFRTPLYFALGFIAMFTMGGLSGVMHASPPVDLQQTDSYFVVAHLHYVLFGGSMFALRSFPCMCWGSWGCLGGSTRTPPTSAGTSGTCSRRRAPSSPLHPSSSFSQTWSGARGREPARTPIPGTAARSNGPPRRRRHHGTSTGSRSSTVVTSSGCASMAMRPDGDLGTLRGKLRSSSTCRLPPTGQS